MLKANFIRKNINSIEKNLSRRGFIFNKNYFTFLFNKKKELHLYLEQLYIKKKNNSKQYLENSNVVSKLEQNKLKENTFRTEEFLRVITQELLYFLRTIPNILHTNVSYKDTILTEYFISYRKNCVQNEKKTGLTYISLLQKQVNTKKAAEMAGSKFTIFCGEICKLQRSLCQYMLDLHTLAHNYTELYVPFLLKGSALIKSCHLPKFTADQFKINDQDLWLNPTGEVPLINYVSNVTIKEEELPLNFVCHTTCFRKEVGSYGKNAQGLLRQHQFEKVELVKIVSEKKSYEQLEILVEHARTVLVKLGLQHRVVRLGTKNIGFSAAKTYDIDVWYPCTKKYVEVSSCSNTESYQVNMLNIKVKSNEKINNTLNVHVLNGSGLAVFRVLYAIIENYQTKDGKHVRVPHVLRQYLQKDYISLY